MSVDRRTVDTGSRGATLASFIREFHAAREAGWGNPLGYLFIAPALLLYLVFNIWPMVRGFLMAFSDYRFLYPDSRWDMIGLANFREMLSDSAFWQSLGVSARYTLLVVPTTLVLALFLAVLISRVARFAGLYRWIVYLPTILPIAVALLMWGQFYGFRFGFINTNLRALGMERPPRWLQDVRYALPAIAAADIWRGFGFPTLLFLIGIYNINSELYEAAAIDGANAWNQFSKITLPLLKPTFALVLVLSSAILGATEQMLILTDGGPQYATRTIGLYLYRVAFTFGDLRLGYASAMSLALGLISMTLTLFWFRVLRER